jgi:hypothetical protein
VREAVAPQPPAFGGIVARDAVMRPEQQREHRARGFSVRCTIRS